MQFLWIEHHDNALDELLEYWIVLFKRPYGFAMRMFPRSICNCHKYLYRHNTKGRNLEDIRKMVWYANKYIELCEKEQNHE